MPMRLPCEPRDSVSYLKGYYDARLDYEVRLKEKRVDWCPLVEVPTHGRLIDADKLYKKVKAECNPYGKPSISYEDGLIVLDLIDDAPTVIEASEDSEQDE